MQARYVNQKSFTCSSKVIVRTQKQQAGLCSTWATKVIGRNKYRDKETITGLGTLVG